MKLGAFSVSLTVKDLKVSKEFYEKLGFDSLGGDLDHGYLIMKKDETVIGLFQGMFDKNILTFNPGWDQSAQNLDEFTDVRELHKEFTSNGIETMQENLEGVNGPGSFVVVDPDGNPILFDQHR
jgi:lactoylglutathione lyase